jgi:DNA-directed RNA polymerase subunit M
MEFCPDCGTRLTSSRKKEGSKTVIRLVCQKCGYIKPEKHNPADAAKKIARTKKEVITVIRKEDDVRTLPTQKIACPKCGNNTAYFWQVQTRGGDEGSTLFFRCTKCDHTFREYT